MQSLTYLVIYLYLFVIGRLIVDSAIFCSDGFGTMNIQIPAIVFTLQNLLIAVGTAGNVFIYSHTNSHIACIIILYVRTVCETVTSPEQAVVRHFETTEILVGQSEEKQILYETFRDEIICSRTLQYMHMMDIIVKTVY